MIHTDTFVLVVMCGLTGVLLHWLPLWRRQSLWFGVTVPAGFSETVVAREMLRRYRLTIWIATVLAAVCVFAGMLRGWPLLFPLALVAEMIVASAAFAVERRRVLPFSGKASGVRSASLVTTHEGLPGGLGAVLVPLGMLGATAAYLHAHWLQLPERFPVHWSLDGTPNRWAGRTWQGVYGPLVVCAIISMMMIGMAELIIHNSPRGRGTGTEEWTTRFRRANLTLLVAGVWIISGMMCAISLLPLISTSGRPTWMIVVLPFIVIGAMLPFVWQLVRLTRDKSSGSDGTPDRCWKLGQIYINPDDPAMLVEKRFGVGYTLNLGNRGLLWILGVAILVFVLIRVMMASS